MRLRSRFLVKAIVLQLLGGVVAAAAVLAICAAMN